MWPFTHRKRILGRFAVIAQCKIGRRTAAVLDPHLLPAGVTHVSRQ
jgi:hypothetical protein